MQKRFQRSNTHAFFIRCLSQRVKPLASNLPASIQVSLAMLTVGSYFYFPLCVNFLNPFFFGAGRRQYYDRYIGRFPGGCVIFIKLVDQLFDVGKKEFERRAFFTQGRATCCSRHFEQNIETLLQLSSGNDCRLFWITCWILCSDCSMSSLADGLSGLQCIFPYHESKPANPSNTLHYINPSERCRSGIVGGDIRLHRYSVK